MKISNYMAQILNNTIGRNCGSMKISSKERFRSLTPEVREEILKKDFSCRFPLREPESLPMDF